MKLSNTLVPFTALSLSSTSAFADAASDGAGFIGSLTLLALIIFFVIRSISSLLPQKGCPILRLIKAKAKARSENVVQTISIRQVAPPSAIEEGWDTPGTSGITPRK